MEKLKVVFRKDDKVILRPVEEQDVPLFQMWMNDPEVTNFIGQFMPCSLEQEKEWQKRTSERRQDALTLAIVDAEKDVLIGCMGLNRIDYISGVGYTGTVIGNKEYWGKGYGTSAKKLLLEFAFNQLNLRKIYSDVIAYNERSLKYANKCGYVQEARLPDYYYKNGKYWDKVILAVTRKEWEKLPK